MVNFPKLGNVEEPPMRKLTPEEYLRFCDFCLKANPHITPENCMDRNPIEITVPFSVR